MDCRTQQLRFGLLHCSCCSRLALLFFNFRNFTWYK